MDKDTGKNAYLIEDSVANESFTFGEEEYFLCQSMDGSVSAEEILSRFERFFGEAMTEESLQQVAEHVCALGLAEKDTSSIATPALKSWVPDDIPDPLTDDGDEIDLEDDDDPDEERPYHLLVANPERFFNFVLKLVLPFKKLMMASHWLLIIAFPSAIYALILQHNAIVKDLMEMRSIILYVGEFILTLFTLSAIRTIVEGTICCYHGARVTQFGWRLHAGVIPRWWVDRSRISRLGRSAKLWVYSASMLLKMYIISLGVLTWYICHRNGSRMSGIVIEVVYIAMVDLAVIMVPVFKDDGSRWLTTYFGLPPRALDIAMQVTVAFFRGKPLLTTLTTKERVLYILFGLTLTCAWIAMFTKVSLTIGEAMVKVFPGIFGQVTALGITAIVGFFVVRWGHFRFIKPFMTMRELKDKREEWLRNRKEKLSAMKHLYEEPKPKKKRYRVLTAICLVLILPYWDRVGGAIDILPPNQHAIQSPLVGKVEEVFFKGGDGIRIPKGTLVAKMTFDDVENSILVLARQVEEKKALAEKAKVVLGKLVSGFRPEDIEEAKAQFAAATEEVDVAAAELEAAKTTALYASQLLKIIQGLFAKGVYSQVQLNDAQSKSELADIGVARAKQNLAAKEDGKKRAQAHLDLIMAGPRPEDIEAERRIVEGAEAEEKRVEQQLAYAKKEQEDGYLKMPFDGYLMEPRLDFKVGTYLKVGDVFATAQENSQQFVVVYLPEYDAGKGRIGYTAEIKLFAYSDEPIYGKVVSIEPASTTKPAISVTSGNVFEALIEVDKPPANMKPGMVGYGKIDVGWNPLCYILVRPIIRFFKVEVWSWLP